jgi:hypothetical protein
VGKYNRKVATQQKNATKLMAFQRAAKESTGTTCALFAKHLTLRLTRFSVSASFGNGAIFPAVSSARLTSAATP